MTFPVKVDLVKPRNTSIVEWVIGNTCNYDCSFCNDEFKSGSKRFLDLSVYKEVIDKAIEQSNGKKIWFKITGGEPTLFPKLVELMTYIKQKGQYTYLITNGSRTMRFWQEVKDSSCMDIIAFTYHPEQTSDLSYFLNVVNLFEDSPTITLVNVTCLPSHFNEAIIAFQTVKENSATYLNLQQINDVDGMSKYTDAQKQILLKCSNSKTTNFHRKAETNVDRNYMYHDGFMKYEFEDGSERVEHAIYFIKNGQDNFFGYSCDIGTSYVRIVHDTIQRSTCGAGERWSIHAENIFQKEPIVCPYTSCTCTLDIIFPKTKI